MARFLWTAVTHICAGEEIQKTSFRFLSGAIMNDYGPIVKAYCQCGETAVYIYWPRRPCGKCGGHVILDKDDLTALSSR